MYANMVGNDTAAEPSREEMRKVGKAETIVFAAGTLGGVFAISGAVLIGMLLSDQDLRNEHPFLAFTLAIGLSTAACSWMELKGETFCDEAESRPIKAFRDVCCFMLSAGTILGSILIVLMYSADGYSLLVVIAAVFLPVMNAKLIALVASEARRRYTLLNADSHEFADNAEKDLGEHQLSDDQKSRTGLDSTMSLDIEII